MIGRRLRAACALCLVLSAAAAAAAAASEERHVVVNGKRLAGTQLEKLDRADCRPIPDGDYWLNRRSGTWGYTGERTVQGRIGDGCQVRQSVKPKSRSINRAGSEPAEAGSTPKDEIQREEPITGTSPLLRTPDSEPDKP